MLENRSHVMRAEVHQALTASVSHAASAGKLALVFPGGGSQYVGMGLDLYQHSPEAREVFDSADRVLGFPLSQLCFSGPSAELDDTANAQPAAVVVSAAILAAMRVRLGNHISALCVAGHSTGQYSALLAAEALGLDDAIRVVQERGRLMRRAAEGSREGMAAVIGLDSGDLEEICRASGQVWVSNYNAPGQTVIAGAEDALQRASELARERGARRVIRLAVNVASHTPLMAPASKDLASCLAALSMQRARVPVIANSSASPLIEPQGIREELVRHLSSPVRWVESISRMIAMGVTTFVEVGPKDVLCGLIKRIDGRATVVSVGTEADIAALEVG